MTGAAQRLMTVDEFLATAESREGRWEIEHGVAYAMAPERLDHGRVKGDAYVALRAALRRAGLPCEAVIDSVAVRVTSRTAYQPDVLIYCGPRLPPDIREIANPVIVVEVVSPSTERRDERQKLVGYSSLPSVAHYLTIDPRDRSVLHYRHDGDGQIAPRILYDGDLTLDPPGLQLAIADLFPPE